MAKDFMAQMIGRAKECPARICLPEAQSADVVLLGERIVSEGIGTPIFVGPCEDIVALMTEAGIADFEFEAFDNTSEEQVEGLADAYLERFDNFSRKAIIRRIKDPLLCSMVLLKLGHVDCVAAGKECPTGNVIEAAMGIVGLAEGVRSASSLGIADIPGFEGPQGTMLGLADCAITAQPTVKELAGTLRRFGRENGITFVLATQNPMAVDMSHMDEIRLLVPMDDGSTRILNNFDHFGEEGDHDVMAPVLSGLTVSRNFMRTENRRTVFVEGSTDYFYLNAFSEMFRSEGEVIDIDFIPMNGLGSRTDDPKVLLGQLTAVERYPLVFTDGDRAGEAFKKAAEKMNIHPSNVSEVFEGRKKVIEDLFTQKDAEKLDVGEKSFDTAACLSYRIPSMKGDLDEETCDNFRRVIDYIMNQ